ncbi:hypothetical protein [Planotetraspora kaengkrachanensis]|uniref:Uncharacterized protein n=1 Tax=Planotetraspora kaengkrachanensis TaxID=575193 RepID=A0A8J3Q193_9ACTN|nr:hypothetical protein [Planotetraspora kaengkrachanensis]GIG84789.1 hypothetical protein Pka01_79160 [Planotetraspora kaengkrachanensis]
MYTPDSAERDHTLRTAVARYDELRVRESLGSPADEDLDWPDAMSGRFAPPQAALSKEEALELLALGEVIARKAAYGRQLTVRTARAAGASWSQIGAALGTTKQSAWEAHTRWIDGQAAFRDRTGTEGMDGDQVRAARELAGDPDEPADSGAL